VQFLALDCWNGTKSQAESFVANTGITYPLLRDAGGVTNDYAGGYDYVYVVGGDGRVTHRNLSGWNTSEVQTAIESALDELIATSAPPAREAVQLRGPWPNPFNPRTELRIEIPGGGDVVSLFVHDARGRRVRTVLDGMVTDEAALSVVWDGAADDGASVPSGVYHFRLVTGAGTDVRKGVLIR